MLENLQAAVLRCGGKPDPETGRAREFGDPRGELRACLSSCALADRSVLGRILASGPDLLDLLQRLSTADMRGLQAGRGRPTVLTSPKGRIVERLWVHNLGEKGCLIVTGPDGSGRATGHLDRFTFREDTGLTDVTRQTVQLVLLGPAAADALRAAGLEVPAAGGSVTVVHDVGEVTVLDEDGSGGAGGYSLVAGATIAGPLWERLVPAVERSGGRPAGEFAVESLRILLGLPASPHELNEDHNPLEAGLIDLVSFDKGCYVGQEVIARLNTYDKVSRSLVGLELPDECEPPEPGSDLIVDGERCGRLTSSIRPPDWPHAIALGYLKLRSAREMVDVRADPGTVRARVVPLPFDVSQT